MIHRVYRLYDARGCVLYVGVTSNTMSQRLAAHRRNKPWFADVVRHEVSRSMPEPEAFLEEQRQIVELRPLHNSYPGKVRTSETPAPSGFPAALRAARVAAALSPAELAEAGGFSLQSLRQWEAGGRLPDSIRSLALGEVLGVDLLEPLLADVTKAAA